MSNYSIRYNRATNHIAGIACKTESTGEEKGGVVAYYAENACGSLTRYALAQGASYDSLQEALEAARITGGRKVCKTCEKAALAALEAIAKAEVEAAATPEPAKDEIVDGAEHQVGDKLYFLPGERKHGYRCPAGEVVVTRVIDHGEPTLYAPRFSYVVQVPGISATAQGTTADELHEIGKVPMDYRFDETVMTAICADCRQQVTYANTKIVSEPVVREGKTYHGQTTTRERRVCAHH